jgi:hypothetical protein
MRPLFWPAVNGLAMGSRIDLVPLSWTGMPIIASIHAHGNHTLMVGAGVYTLLAAGCDTCVVPHVVEAGWC